ncbi:MAG TPA: DUF971 domain-containing protein [Anaerolineales bacterium]|nr:DUF971 domain-containing protein [Anaerolineales bacterium]
MSNVRPTGITANRNTSELTVTWNDGHESVYSFTLLRKACPCAECRGGHENMGGDPDPEIYLLPPEDTPATRLRNVEAVGTYAVTFYWEDGHHFGIYNWDFLRRLCPCPECRAKYGSA